MSAPTDPAVTPTGDLAIRMLAMPANTNPNGDIFGGWVVSNMDLAGISVAMQFTSHRMTTVAMDKMVFIAPIKVGDFVCCYAKVLKTGRTSVTIGVETWAVGAAARHRRQVTSGVITYVAIDSEGRPVPLDRKA